MNKSQLKKIGLNVFRVLSFIAILPVLAALMFWLTNCRLNLSPSSPVGIWKINELSSVEKDAYVLVDSYWDKEGIKRGIHKNGMSPMIKKVVGLPGELVEKKDACVYISGEKITGSKIAEKGKDGTPSPKVGYPYVIPEDSFYVMSDKEGGWDSRYFGPVPRTVMLNRATLVWRWK